MFLEKKGVSIKTGPKLNNVTNPDGFQKRYNRCC